MGHHVHLGPLPLSRNRLSPMMKEICSRKNHIDLTFKCDDGSFGVHKMLGGGGGGRCCGVFFLNIVR